MHHTDTCNCLYPLFDRAMITMEALKAEACSLVHKLMPYIQGISPLQLAGYAAVSYVSMSFMRHFLWTPFKLYALAQMFPVDLKKYGEWAVVTGATDGIGKNRIPSVL